MSDRSLPLAHALAGHDELERVLGESGMEIVHPALDVKHKRHVALNDESRFIPLAPLVRGLMR